MFSNQDQIQERHKRRKQEISGNGTQGRRTLCSSKGLDVKIQGKDEKGIKEGGQHKIPIFIFYGIVPGQCRCRWQIFRSFFEDLFFTSFSCSLVWSFHPPYSNSTQKQSEMTILSPVARMPVMSISRTWQGGFLEPQRHRTVCLWKSSAQTR